MRRKKYVYFFGEGNAQMRDLLGGKGANLAEMTNLGLPVPPGFTISTEACAYVSRHGHDWPQGLTREVAAHLDRLEQAMHARLGAADRPLLVSVRSGAAVSMPGMMDTVLNLGLNADVTAGLAVLTGNERFAWDAYRRFVQMFGNVVRGIPAAVFDERLEAAKQAAGVHSDAELDAGRLQELVTAFQQIYQSRTGEAFPVDPRVQLEQAINAVFASWDNERAITYRQLNDIRGLKGTAVNVQAMVFGNMGPTSGTGVCFSRDLATGRNRFYGEYLMNAQGEDVVAGIRTAPPLGTLARKNPAVYKQLVAMKDRLEKHYRDMQDIEFTIQEGRLFILQTRTGKRTAQAALKIAVDMVRQQMITPAEALLRIDPAQLDQLLHPCFDPEAEKQAQMIARGLPASPGAATGRIVFTADDAQEWAARGERVILTRIETSPEDLAGMDAAVGILTSRGGTTSHAAVVARGMGKCCVSGARRLTIDYRSRKVTVGDVTLRGGDRVSLNGSTGAVYVGEVATTDARLSRDFKTLMQWADECRRLGVRVNADTPEEAALAVRFGAEGIGLCRTEHMFFQGERIVSVRKMILADDTDSRERALAELLPLQRQDFEGLFRAMKGRPVTIRLIDPPLHEFMPHDRPAQQAMADALGIPLKKVHDRVIELQEINPMLGYRGCRLGITNPEIIRMQVRAIIEAAVRVKRARIPVEPEIMIPLVGETGELEHCMREIEATVQQVFSEQGMQVPYRIGTMIEVPRAVLIADKLAAKADFFSFGTNDLTQMTCGFSRDDAGRFLKEYVDRGIFDKDPFQKLDQEGVGQMIRMGVERGRRVRPDLKVGICGEHGGEPSSIDFCHRTGLDYVSCSPYRVPIARLAAAQAAIREQQARESR